MDENMVDTVLSCVQKGNRVLFRRGHTGYVGIKIKFGPMFFFTQRYKTDSLTFEEIKKRLKINMHSLAMERTVPRRQ